MIKNLPGSAENIEDSSSIPGLGRFPGGGRFPGRNPCTSILAWKIPWTEEPGRLQSMGLQRVKHDWALRHQIY